jgi:hypothetical protein
MERRRPNLTIQIVNDAPEETTEIPHMNERDKLNQNIRSVFTQLKNDTKYKDSIPENIDEIINHMIDTLPKSIEGVFITSRNRGEKFADVVFERTSFTSSGDTFIKRCITTNNHLEKNAYSICSIIMEIAMQKYAYDKLQELQELQQFNNIHIPRIINYYIEDIKDVNSVNSCIIEMEKIPKEYIKLSDYLNPNKNMDLNGGRQGKRNPENSSESPDQKRLRKENPPQIQSRVSDSVEMDEKQKQKINTVKDLATQLSKLFNSINVLHNDAKADNIFIYQTPSLTSAYIIDFGRSEIYIGKDKPVLYESTNNSLPTFHGVPSDKYTEDLDYFIRLNQNLLDVSDAHFMESPRLGGKSTRKKRSLTRKKRSLTRKKRSL